MSFGFAEEVVCDEVSVVRVRGCAADRNATASCGKPSGRESDLHINDMTLFLSK